MTSDERVLVEHRTTLAEGVFQPQGTLFITTHRLLFLESKLAADLVANSSGAIGGAAAGALGGLLVGFAGGLGGQLAGGVVAEAIEYDDQARIAAANEQGVTRIKRKRRLVLGAPLGLVTAYRLRRLNDLEIVVGNEQLRFSNAGRATIPSLDRVLGYEGPADVKVPRTRSAH